MRDCLTGVLVVAVFACLYLAGLCNGLNAGYTAGEKSVRRAAIAAGAAHWRVDPQTGETEFAWGKP